MKCASAIKTILFVGVLTATAASHAKCISDMSTQVTCTQSLETGGSEVLAQLADRIDVCQKEGKLFIAFEAEGTGPVDEVQATSTAESTFYDIFGDKTVIFSVDKKSTSEGHKKGQLVAGFGDQQSKVNFTCQDRK